MTGEGNILVEDTLTSCQTNLDSPDVQQNFFKTIKSWSIARWLFYHDSAKQNTVELSTGIDLIINLLEYIFPKDMINIL
uniref:Uncharacterized protein n=1 Tax=Ditylenchus dipsaci TaxID=166011 RepID=A0A915E4M9_9BILA